MKERKKYRGINENRTPELEHPVPEVELPVEPAPGHVGGGDVLETLVRDHVNHGAHHSFSIKKQYVKLRAIKLL